MNEKRKLTLSEEDLYAEDEQVEETVQMVIFRLSGEWYALDIGSVKEVQKIESVAYLPSCPDHITGIIRLRGNIVSVTDLKKILGLSPEELNKTSRLVVIEENGLLTGLLTDEVYEAVTVPVSSIGPPLATISPEKAEYLKGECRVDDKLVGILDAGKVLEKTRILRGGG